MGKCRLPFNEVKKDSNEMINQDTHALIIKLSLKKKQLDGASIKLFLFLYQGNIEDL
jgi:hypothetical protein